MVQINWTLQSIEDIESIAEFIAKDSVKYAQIQVVSFFESVENLKAYPKIGRSVPEFKNPKIRQILCGSFRIIYLIKSKHQIDILTVHHSRRKLKNLSLHNFTTNFR
jgi:plasmid stabilization system protein ParE